MPNCENVVVGQGLALWICQLFIGCCVISSFHGFQTRPNSVPDRTMSKSKKAARIGICCLFVVVIATTIGCFGLTCLLYRFTGEPYFDNARDRAKLQRIAEPCKPIIAAIEKHRSSHGTYPEGLDGLDANIEGVQEAKVFLGQQNYTAYYQANEGEFILHVKLNWDGGLNFESRLGHWRYDPGNGDPDWPIR